MTAFLSRQACPQKLSSRFHNTMVRVRKTANPCALPVAIETLPSHGPVVRYEGQTFSAAFSWLAPPALLAWRQHALERRSTPLAFACFHGNSLFVAIKPQRSCARLKRSSCRWKIRFMKSLGGSCDTSGLGIGGSFASFDPPSLKSSALLLSWRSLPSGIRPDVAKARCGGAWRP